MSFTLPLAMSTADLCCLFKNKEKVRADLIRRDGLRYLRDIVRAEADHRQDEFIARTLKNSAL